MSNPSVRDRTTRFNRLREGFHSDFVVGIRSVGNSLEIEEKLIKSPPRDHEHTAINMTNHNLPPQWMEVLQSIDHDIDEITRQIGMLKECHSQKLRIMFDDEKSKKYDQNIQETTRSITRLFQRSKQKLKKIAIKGNENNSAGFEEKTIRYNVMKSRATTLQEWTKVFRDSQRSYLESMKKKNVSSNKYLNYDETETFNEILPDFERISKHGLNHDQIVKFRKMEKNASHRATAIINIAKSVHELAQIFNELNVLIVEQGSVLDRIDYNVEQTIDNLHKARNHLDIAEKKQKGSKTALCIIVLVCAIALAGFILIIRHA